MAGSIKTQYDHRFLLQLGKFGLVALTAPTAGRGSNYIRLAYCFFLKYILAVDGKRQMETDGKHDVDHATSDAQVTPDRTGVFG